jgi:FkbM family methyltransferase
MGLRRLLRTWERRRLLGAVPELVDKSKAQLNQDLWVIAETRRKRRGFFVEIGAFDGILHSNTYLLEKELDWTGILVEPNPGWHDLLRQRRSAALSTKAISSRRGTVDFVAVRNEPALSGLAAHAYDDKHAARRGDAGVISVETTTVGDLLEEHAAPQHIDYVSIDTEGSEFEILSAFDFNRYRVDLISVEHNYTAQEADTERLLNANGFQRVHRRISRFDAWYKRK